jgi:HPt (histidine-containing phosphotransfer) domain-containing protein
LLSAAFAAGDIATMRREAHALKSASASLGAVRLAELLTQIEVAAGDARVSDAQRLGESLHVAADEVFAQLRGLSPVRTANV